MITFSFSDKVINKVIPNPRICIFFGIFAFSLAERIRDMTALINKYDETVTAEYTALLDRSIKGLPFTLEHPLGRLYATAEGGEYSKAKDYLLEFFELSSQYISAVLFSLLRGVDGASAQVARVVEKIDTKRPLSFGDWCNDILPPLSSALIHLLPDAPLSTSLRRRTEQKGNLFVGGKNEPSIVAIRNQYKGHGTMVSDEKYRELVVALEPRLMELLHAVEPLCKCTVLPQQEHFWIEGPLAPGIDKADLFPLLFCDAEGHRYIFQSLNDERANYVSADEGAESQLTTIAHNMAIDAFFQAFMPSFDIAKLRNWSEWSSLLLGETDRFLQGVYREKKYNRELFVERGGLTSQLLSFLNGGAILFPLPGEAGQGKSCQLCYWSESLATNAVFFAENGMARPVTPLILSGSQLSSTNMDSWLRRLFGLAPRKKLSKVIDELHTAAVNADSQLLIMVDALNECENYDANEDAATKGESSAVALFRDLIELFVRPQYTNFKILVTCRNYTWKQLLQPCVSLMPEGTVYVGDGNGDAPVVRGFTDDELRQAYAIYSDVYSIHTPFSSLSRSLAIRLKDPLVLKIACTNYLGNNLPETTRRLTSLALWSQLGDNVRNAYAGRKQLEILNAISTFIFDSYVAGKASNCIPVADLQKALDEEEHPLHALSHLIYVRDNEGGDWQSQGLSISVAFAELINRPERPILRYADNQIQFVYERFLEYMLAVALRSSINNVGTADFNSLLHSLEPDEVMLGALRNVLIMNYAESGDSRQILGLIADNSDDFITMTVVTDVMNVLVRENYEEELFSIENDLIVSEAGAAHTELIRIIREFNELSKQIASNKATSDTIGRFNTLHDQLQPHIRLRTMAIQTLLGGIFLTDYFNEKLYRRDPFEFLWQLTDDPLVEVKDAVCLQSYYIYHQYLTLGGEPIERNLSEHIVGRMYDWIDGHSLPTMLLSRRNRKRMMIFLETATRLLVLLVIDVLLSEKPEQQYRVPQMLDRLRGTVRHLTLNHSLIRMVLPALNIVMRRQLTFQSDYVNNAIEYARFWQAIPRRGEGNDGWDRTCLPEVMECIYQYSRYYSQGDKKRTESPDFTRFAPMIVAAYQTGDSLSYFVLERLLVINGVCDWKTVQPMLSQFDDEFRRGNGVAASQWWDYSQMSLIYVLYQLGMKMEQMPDEVYDMLGRWCEDWTRRLKGLFVAPNSNMANSRQKYKRNVMTWYAMVYAYRYGDIRRDAYQSVPLFYNLMDEAVDNRDGDLLTHLVDNVSELVSDSGYVNTALNLLSHLMRLCDSKQMLEEMGVAQTLPQQIALLLSTAKSYAPQPVNSFLASEILQLPFPGVHNYRDEILNYTPCGEKLSDLLTHRFGNFIIYALIHQEPVDDFCYNVAQRLDKTENFTQWFAYVVRLLLHDLLKIKIKTM